MLRNTRQLKGLVNDIMDLSKLESKKAKLIEEPVNAKSFFTRIASNYESLAKHLNISYQVHLNIPASLTILMDAPKVEKIINNL